MTSSGIEQDQIPNASAMTEQMIEVVSLASQEIGWGGSTLPPLVVLGKKVIPVVQFLPAAFERLERGERPELDGDNLSMWESWPVEDHFPAPGQPLRMIGFASIFQWPAAFASARQLSGFGAGMIITGLNGQARVGAQRLLAADSASITVAHRGHQGEVEVQTVGRIGPSDRATRTLTTRWLEEQIYRHALDSGTLHADTAVQRHPPREEPA